MRSNTDGSFATDDGGLAAIVEFRDATDEQRAVREVNSSIYVFRADRLWAVLDRLTPHNAQGELYLTDSVALLVEDGDRVAVHKGDDPVETEGVNTRVELAAAAGGLRDRINEGAHARRRHDRRPREHVDRRRRRSRGRRCDPPVHGDPRSDADRGSRRDRPARGRRRRDDRRGRARRPVLLPPSWHRSRGRTRRPARSSRSRTRTSASGRRFRISPTSGMRMSAPTRTSQPETSRRTRSTRA